MTPVRAYIRALLLETTLCPFPKAVFMAGGPGSGKSTVIRRLQLAEKLKIINPDDAYEESLKAAGLPLDRSEVVEKYKPLKQQYMQAVESNDTALVSELEPEYLALRAIMSKNMQLFAAARSAAKEVQASYTCDNESFLVDGTGGNFREIAKHVKELRDLGYDVAMVYVDVPLETSVERNRARGEEGGRRLYDKTVERSWGAVNRNLGRYEELFGDNFFYIDASEDAFDESIAAIAPQVGVFLSRE